MAFQSANQTDSSPRSAWAVDKRSSVNASGEPISFAPIVSGELTSLTMLSKLDYVFVKY